MEKSYENIPCMLRASESEEGLTLDTWKPSVTKSRIVPSEWRQKQIAGDYNQKPGIDEVRKIKMYLKKKIPDYEIMHAFGINAETLMAIQHDNYEPTNGIVINVYHALKTFNMKMKELEDNLNTYKKYMSNKDYKLRKKTILVLQENPQVSLE